MSISRTVISEKSRQFNHDMDGTYTPVLKHPSPRRTATSSDNHSKSSKNPGLSYSHQDPKLPGHNSTTVHSIVDRIIITRVPGTPSSITEISSDARQDLSLPKGISPDFITANPSLLRPMFHFLANQMARSEVKILLQELAVKRGLSKTNISRLCNVPVSSVRRPRADILPPSNLGLRLARLVVFMDLLENVAHVKDPAAWLTLRLVENHTVTAVHIYQSGMVINLLNFAFGHLDLPELLNLWNPEWQTATRSEWRVVKGPDGDRILVRRA